MARCGFGFVVVYDLILFPACSGLEFVILVFLGFVILCFCYFGLGLVFGLKLVLGGLVSLGFCCFRVFRGFLVLIFGFVFFDCCRLGVVCFVILGLSLGVCSDLGFVVLWYLGFAGQTCGLGVFGFLFGGHSEISGLAYDCAFWLFC